MNIMLFKSLPRKIRELAIKEAAKQEVYLKDEDLDKPLSFLFVWFITEEGFKFWEDINNGIFSTFYKKYGSEEKILSVVVFEEDNNEEGYIYYKEEYIYYKANISEKDRYSDEFNDACLEIIADNKYKIDYYILVPNEKGEIDSYKYGYWDKEDIESLNESIDF